MRTNKEIDQEVRRDHIYRTFWHLIHREPKYEEVRDIERKMEQEDHKARERASMPLTPPDKQFVVLNHNRGGQLIACLVRADTKEEAVKKRARQLAGYDTTGLEGIVGVSGSVPSQHGQGGAYVYHVEAVPPTPPEPRIIASRTVTNRDKILR